MKKHSNRQKHDKYGLEGDGVIEEFFHLLWTKDPLFGTSNFVTFFYNVQFLPSGFLIL